MAASMDSFDIPHADELANQIVQDKASHEERNKQRQEVVRVACDLYEKFLLQTVQNAIPDFKAQNRVCIQLEITLTEDKSNFNGIPPHVLQYGHLVDNKYYQRSPLEVAEMPFVKVQKFLFTKGYYLLDESNPTYSKNTFIKLYCVRPTNLETRPVLWHGKNVMPSA